MTEEEGKSISTNRRFKKHRYPEHVFFQDILQDIAGRTMVGTEKLQIIYESSIIADFLPGAVAEAGVWMGGTMYLLASVMKEKTIYGFDSWEGLPVPSDKLDVGHIMGEGWGKTDVPVEYLSKFGERISLHKGWFIDTLPSVKDEQFCLVHIDADLYESVKTCFEFFIPRMVSGGIIICDDYGFRLTPGATIAVDEVMQSCNKSYDYYNTGNLVLRFT
jgi:O-methyltransferase